MNEDFIHVFTLARVLVPLVGESGRDQFVALGVDDVAAVAGCDDVPGVQDRSVAPIFIREILIDLDSHL